MVWTVDLGITETVNDNETGLRRESTKAAKGVEGLQDSVQESLARIGDTT